MLSEYGVVFRLDKSSPCADKLMEPGAYTLELSHDGESNHAPVFISQSTQTKNNVDAEAIISSHSCNGCDLSNSDLSYYDFTGVNFAGANFNRSDLTSSVFFKADFSNATFKGAKLFDTTWTDGFLCGKSDVTNCNPTAPQIAITNRYDFGRTNRTKLEVYCATPPTNKPLNTLEDLLRSLISMEDFLTSKPGKILREYFSRQVKVSELFYDSFAPITTIRLSPDVCQGKVPFVLELPENCDDSYYIAGPFNSPIGLVTITKDGFEAVRNKYSLFANYYCNR